MKDGFIPSMTLRCVLSYCFLFILFHYCATVSNRHAVLSSGRGMMASSFLPPIFMSCCSSGNCTGCKVGQAVVLLVLTITSVAAFIGVWNTHMLASGWSFGTQEGSLAILALVFSFTMWGKKMSKMCPCNKVACAEGAGKCC